LGTSDLNYFTLRQLLSVSSSSIYLSILYPEELPTANCQLPTANSQQPTTMDSDSDSGSIYQQRVNTIGPRVVGTIVLLCSLSMLFMAWKRRDRLFHRLVLGK
jgi:hypothetical protein